jgi:hypothetical protein
MDRVGFGRAHPYFFSGRWFQRECIEALLIVNLWGMFLFHGADEEYHGNRDLRTSKRCFVCGW